MLLKHPDQYSDEELEAWVRHLVGDEVSEGPRLDYKQTIALNSEKERLEAAKDISSFANEIGGTIIYGIQEDRKSDEIAIPLKPYGIDPIPGLESRLENIYVDSITPHLPEWRIRKIELTEYSQKVIYIAWVPESWVGVHMVQAYGDQRYYRRGQLRAVAMSEHEVRQRYERLRIGQYALKDFLNSSELNYLGAYLPKDKFISHYVACPAMLFPERVNFATSDMRGWLNKNRYELWEWFSKGTFDKWVSFAYGVRARLSVASGMVELHRNGAISHWSEAVVRQNNENQERYELLYLEELKGIEGFLQFARSFYQKIQYVGPLHFQVRIQNLPPKARVENRMDSTFPPADPYNLFMRSDDLLITTFDGNIFISLSKPSSKLVENPNKILKDIADEMFRAFGLWEADCFDDQLNLKKP
jgi:hypothetical protein